MLRLIMYALLFVLGYRVLKRFFSPDYGNLNQGGEAESFQSFPGDKSDEVEDVEYEEIE